MKGIWSNLNSEFCSETLWNTKKYKDKDIFPISLMFHLYWKKECRLQIDFSPFRKVCLPFIHFRRAFFSAHIKTVEQNKFFQRWNIWNQPSVLCVCTIHWMSVCVTHGQKTWLDHGPWPWETQTFRVFHCAFAKRNLTDVFAHTSGSFLWVSPSCLEIFKMIFSACLFQFLAWLGLALLARIFTIIHENLGESCEVAVFS